MTAKEKIHNEKDDIDLDETLERNQCDADDRKVDRDERYRRDIIRE